MTIEEAFGAVIRRLRREQQISQDYLANTSGLDRSSISKIECGKQEPCLITIFSIAKAFNTLPSVVMNEVELLLRHCHPEMFKTEANSWEINWVSKIEEVINKSSDCYNGFETILIAEDQALVSNMLSSYLTDYGYKVIVARNGNEAIDKFKQHLDEIQLMILDVVMPYKSGYEVHSEIKMLKADLKSIFISGYREDDLAWIGENTFIYKPFSPIDMLKVVRSTLDNELLASDT